MNEDILQQTIERFWETVPPMWGKIRKHTRTIAADCFDITFEQFNILRHVSRGIGSVSELAVIKQISRSAISQAVDPLVNKGLINRLQDKEDRRHMHLELTQSGNEVLNTIFRQNRAWMAEKLTSVNADDLKDITHALDLLRSIFKE
jgi:DNA-binding MarR family transcriptional regulator